MAPPSPQGAATQSSQAGNGGDSATEDSATEAMAGPPLGHPDTVWDTRNNDEGDQESTEDVLPSVSQRTAASDQVNILIQNSASVEHEPAAELTAGLATEGKGSAVVVEEASLESEEPVKVLPQDAAPPDTAGLTPHDLAMELVPSDIILKLDRAEAAEEAGDGKLALELYTDCIRDLTPIYKSEFSMHAGCHAKRSI